MKKNICLIFLIAISGCTSIKQYRISSANCTKDLKVDQSKSCGDSYYYEIKNDNSDAEIAIVEFDDQGYFMGNRLPYEIIKQKISNTHSESGALVVVFAHGWKHNADKEDSNLINFEKMLLKMDEIDKELCKNSSCRNRKTIGVFLAWRGLSATKEPFKELSFWNRKKAAHQVGSDGAVTLLADLDRINTRVKPANGSSTNRLILIGHSFGGVIIYSATKQRLLESIANRREGSNSVDASVADQIILINPAFEAARYHNIFEEINSLDFPSSQKQILSIFTSESDTATKKWFKRGRTLSSLFTKYNKEYDDPDYKKNKTQDSGQKSADRTAIGHFEKYQTHELTLEDTKDIDLKKLKCDWQDFITGKSPQSHWDAGNTRLKRIEKSEYEFPIHNPFIIVKVEKDLIKNHTEIWGDDFVNFLYTYVGVQDKKPCGLG